MFELFIYFVVGMIFMRIYNLNSITMDGPDKLMVGMVIIFWPITIFFMVIVGLGTIPGKIIYWYGILKTVQYKRMEEKE